MIRHRANSARNVPARLLYSSRSCEDIIYREELDRLAQKDSSLLVIHTLTRRQHQSWTGYSRRIDRAMLAEIGFQPAEWPLIFVCGSPQMVETVATYLQELGHDPERIKTERFGPTG